MDSLFNGAEARAMELYASLPNVSADEAGLVLLGVGAALGLRYIIKMYPTWMQQRAVRAFERSELERKTKRTQEAMDKREVRLREMLTEMITDGMLHLSVKQEISDQESKRLLAEISQKLNLPDLVPPKTRAEIVKLEIKGRLRKAEKKPRGPKPVKVFREKTRPEKAVGKLVNKYWPAKTAVA